ncbi:hydroxyacid dehydrogenase [Streptomyces luteolus]|uniref:Hydroxyacid dehydrogenase n=1 Tax=Streptomyces luteolus TaxID=3043615 RepID=A0ABT6ST03_9ACTN|nr:hydroxyacid dehydrogenase [Streptomyces sp. B-S-A12]MDI3418728.1 hydroxyacid dehydrogenase [Streptomyces sp. B-S-A12]
MSEPHRPSVVLAMSPVHLPRLFDEPLRRRLDELAEIDLGLVLRDFSTPEAVTALRSAEVLLTCWGAPSVDASVLADAPRLKAIVHAAGSVKHLATAACWQRGIRVSSAAALNAVPVAEYTVAMAVLAGKRAFHAQAAYRAQGSEQFWAGMDADLGNYRITVGVVGASHVGRKVLELLGSYDMDLLLTDPTLSAAEAEELGARLVGLDELVSSSDVVSIHAPDVPETYRLINAERLALMRDGATLINTARGALVDTEALTEELATGRLSAVLDVTDPEPLPSHSPLFTLPNVVLTPHIAGSLGNEVRRLGELAVDELEKYARGEEFAFPVVQERLSILA